MKSRRKALRERNIVSVGRILPRISEVLVRKTLAKADSTSDLKANLIAFPRKGGSQATLAKKESPKLIVTSYHTSRPHLVSPKNGDFFNNREGRKPAKEGKIVSLRIVRS